MEVPVEAVVADQAWHGTRLAEQVVDELDRVVALGGQQRAQPRPEAAYGVQLGVVAVVTAGVGELAKNASRSATDVSVSGGSAELTRDTAACSDSSVSCAKTTLTHYITAA